MKYRLKRIFLWISRCAYSRGFGVQSPSAYHFIRYIINEHYPYYAYDELLKSYPGINKEVRKLAKLYFRIANFAQADNWLIKVKNSAIYQKYICAGCNKTKFLDNISGLSSFEVALVDIALSKDDLNNLLSISMDTSILIVEGIHNNAASLKKWNYIVAHNKVTVCYDVYYCGIVFFDKRIKCTYKVNF